MQINRVVVGDLEENCYIVSINDKCLVIDPADEKDKIIDTINNKEVLGILITHHHFDHIGAVNDLKDKYNCTVYDYTNLEEGINNIEEFSFEVIFNPGHTNDSISFKFDNNMFVGDFIFKNSIGRCDLGGNYHDMEESIKRLKEVSDNLTLYPGHGDYTTLNYEKENNPYF